MIKRSESVQEGLLWAIRCYKIKKYHLISINCAPTGADPIHLKAFKLSTDKLQSTKVNVRPNDLQQDKPFHIRNLFLKDLMW